MFSEKKPEGNVFVASDFTEFKVKYPDFHHMAKIQELYETRKVPKRIKAVNEYLSEIGVTNPCNKCFTDKPLTSFKIRTGKNRHIYSIIDTCKSCKSKAYNKNVKNKALKGRKKFVLMVENNKIRARSASAKRRNKIKNAQPLWANVENILNIYRNCISRENCEVDHVIPLQGKLVSGFHHEDNLQILPAEQNRSKSNKFIPYTERDGVRTSVQFTFTELKSLLKIALLE